jgi:diketogulonate reductase-like aldo/keto reductase
MGQGTWRLGENRAAWAAEAAALRRGLDLGLTLIDTAEMYGDGASERLVGEVIRGARDQAFVVSKVYPQNAGRARMAAACEASLKRLGTERIDLYLLHWRGGIPLAESVEAFERLRQSGKIGAWGVSNFDVEDMEDLLDAGGENCATNQILYNLVRRGPEFDLLPWMANRAMPAMAYSPIEQGRIPANARLGAVARKHAVTAAQVALAFVCRSDQVIAIPKAASSAHVEDNRRAADLRLDEADIAALDDAFPPPRRKQPLEML